MEFIIFYAVFTYLMGLGIYMTKVNPEDKKIRNLVFILAPILIPILLGFMFADYMNNSPFEIED